jgi:hypothetical protein
VVDGGAVCRDENPGDDSDRGMFGPASSALIFTLCVFSCEECSQVLSAGARASGAVAMVAKKDFGDRDP